MSDDDRESDEERFDRTLRNLLNTPPQPRKGKAAEKETGRDKPVRPRSGQRQEERGERG